MPAWISAVRPHADAALVRDARLAEAQVEQGGESVAAAGDLHAGHEVVELPPDAGGGPVGVGVRVAGGDQLQRRDPRRRREGIGVERARVGDSADVVPRGVFLVGDHVEDVPPPGDAAARETTSEDLRQRGQVRRHPKARLRAAGGDAEAGHHLVEDEHSAVPAG